PPRGRRARDLHRVDAAPARMVEGKGGRPYAAARRRDRPRIPARRAAPGAPVGLRKGADARRGRREQPGLDPRGHALARGRSPRRAVPHVGRTDARRRREDRRAGARRVLRLAGRSIMKAGRREWLGLIVLALPCLVVVMDLTILFLAMPTITADLK